VGKKRWLFEYERDSSRSPSAIPEIQAECRANGGDARQPFDWGVGGALVETREHCPSPPSPSPSEKTDSEDDDAFSVSSFEPARVVPEAKTIPEFYRERMDYWREAVPTRIEIIITNSSSEESLCDLAACENRDGREMEFVNSFQDSWS
jgi:hypothetical protein